jgi:hypothetical protein
MPGRRGWAAAALVAAAVAGCGTREAPRGSIRGTVRLGGQPLAEGKVRFFALTGGVSTEGEIRDGRYEIPADRGPTAGKYRVEVVSEKKTGRRVPDRDGAPGDMKDETVNVVPAKYNQGSAVQIDYDPAADRPHDFDLAAK